MPVNWLQDLSWEDVQRYLDKDTRCIVPVGSTEQHGRFAPLGTDTYVAVTLAADASDRSGVIATPPMWFGFSPHHMVVPGTITIRAEVLIEVLYDVLKSLSAHGFTSFVVVNGHRIVNICWMQIAAERAQRELGIRVAIFDPAYMSKEVARDLGFDPIGHGENIEISHMLYRYPHLIHLEKARDNPHQGRNCYHLDPHDPRDTLCYVPATLEDQRRILAGTGDTIGGNPTTSTMERGKAYHDHLVERLLSVLEGFTAPPG